MVLELEARKTAFLLLLQHRPALVGREEVVHIVGVLLFLRQDPLEQHPRRRIPIPEVAHHLAIGFDRNALGNEILLNHVDQILALHVLRSGT